MKYLYIALLLLFGASIASAAETILRVHGGGTGVSTFGGTNHILTTSATDTLTSEAAFVYSQSADLLTVVNATTTNLTASGSLYVPSLAACPAGAASGFSSVCLDTTGTQFQLSTSTAANGFPAVYQAYQTTGFSFASTSQGAATTTVYLAPAAAALSVLRAQCDFNQHMGVSLYDGTNRAKYFLASSTIGTVTFTTNKDFTAGEAIRVDVGTSTELGTAVRGGCRFQYVYTPS